MKLLIYSPNYTPEITGIGKYNGELAVALARRGFDLHVVTAPPYYPEWKRHIGFRNWWNTDTLDGVQIYRCPLYVPAKVTTLKRLIHLVSFSFTSALKMLTLLKLKPDVVFLVQPTLFCAPIALIYSKLTNAKSILHVQDFEIDAVFGLGMIRTSRNTNSYVGLRDKIVSFLQKSAYRIEREIMLHFDVVSSISHSMLGRAEEKGVAREKLLFFPNWADTNFVTPEVDGSRLKSEWGFRDADRLVIYSGNVGRKQGLDLILEAGRAMLDHPDVKFVVIGDGAYRNELLKISEKRNLSNIFFKPLQPWSLVPQILAMADVHLVIQKRGAADSVLPSKLTNILSSGGHALVTADPDTELGRIAEKFPGIFHCVEPESPELFIQGLVHCLGKDTRSTNLVAREYATKYLNGNEVIDRFVADLRAIGETKGIIDYEGQ